MKYCLAVDIVNGEVHEVDEDYPSIPSWGNSRERIETHDTEAEMKESLKYWKKSFSESDMENERKRIQNDIYLRG